MSKRFCQLFGIGLLLVTSLIAFDGTASFRIMLDRYYEDYLRLFPVEAAINGDNDPRYEGVWPNSISSEHRGQVAAMCAEYLAELESVDRASLSSSDQLSYDTLKWSLSIRQQGTKQIFHLLPVNQFSCDTLTFAQMGSGSFIHPFKTVGDFRNFLARARGFSAWVDTAIANMREGIAKGVVQPRVLMERVLLQLEPLAANDSTANIFFSPLKHLPADLPPDEKETLAA